MLRQERDSLLAQIASLREALETAHELLEFHEGSAKPEFQGAHPSILVNGEDWSRVFGVLRAALKATVAK